MTEQMHTEQTHTVKDEPKTAEKTAISSIEVQANTTVKKYAFGAMAVGFIPLPVVDVTALMGVQLKMLHSIARQYNVPFSQNLVKSLVSALLGGVVTLTVSPTVGSIMKIIPGVGQAAGTVSMVAMGGASTYALGKVFIQHFESGGTFLDFEPEKMKKRFQEFLEEGKKFVTRQPKTSESKAN